MPQHYNCVPIQRTRNRELGHRRETARPEPIKFPWAENSPVLVNSAILPREIHPHKNTIAHHPFIRCLGWRVGDVITGKSIWFRTDRKWSLFPFPRFKFYWLVINHSNNDKCCHHPSHTQTPFHYICLSVALSGGSLLVASPAGPNTLFAKLCKKFSYWPFDFRLINFLWNGLLMRSLCKIFTSGLMLRGN